jgi:hypothetical protein
MLSVSLTTQKSSGQKKTCGCALSVSRMKHPEGMFFGVSEITD